MKICNSLTEYTAAGRACVALGFFDGVHAGHRAVIGACCAEKGKDTAVALTFHESPVAALGGTVPPLLTDNGRKAALLSDAGADAVIFADFLSLRDLSPAGFVREVLRDGLHARKVFCGYNYRFGKGGAGDIDALIRLCTEEGIEVAVIPPVTIDGEAVSSTRIRALIAAGEPALAARMLGCPYAICGDISGGNRIGTSLGFPTVNQSVGVGLCEPRRGVYASRVTIDGKEFRGATNIGVHPTVGESEGALCETFLIDYEGGELYGKTAICELLEFIRPERRFPTIDALKEQVMKDVSLIKDHVYVYI